MKQNNMIQDSKSKIPAEGEARLRRQDSGQAALPAVLLICGVITEIAIAGTLVAFVLSSSGLGERLSSQALAAAKAGVQDAFIKITIDKNFNFPAGYNFSVDSRSVLVTVTQGINAATVISTGTALSRQRKLEAILLVDQNTGKVDLKSIREIE